jgi:hypothetical protein
MKVGCFMKRNKKKWLQKTKENCQSHFFFSLSTFGLLNENEIYCLKEDVKWTIWKTKENSESFIEFIYSIQRYHKSDKKILMKL